MDATDSPNSCPTPMHGTTSSRASHTFDSIITASAFLAVLRVECELMIDRLGAVRVTLGLSWPVDSYVAAEQ
jgi:hypothetical protein